jgi:hypothetical protein
VPTSIGTCSITAMIVYVLDHVPIGSTKWLHRSRLGFNRSGHPVWWALCDGRKVGLVALSLCTTAHPLRARFTNILRTSISELTMRLDPTGRTHRASTPARIGCAPTELFSCSGHVLTLLFLDNFRWEMAGSSLTTLSAMHSPTRPGLAQTLAAAGHLCCR